MKKLLTMAAVITVAASMAYAASNEVYSVNIVGFQKMDLPSDFKIISVPFEVEGSLFDVMGTNGTASANASAADNIYIYDNDTGYKFYFLYDGSYGGGIPAGWVDGTYTPATNVYVYPGMSFWYKNVAANENTNVIVGDVVMETIATNYIPVGFSLLSSPFSCDCTLPDLEITNGTSAANASAADNIYIYDNATGYKFYFLYDGSYGGGIPAGWVDGTYTPATNVTISSGEGFWYKANSSFDWVCPRPYDID